ncbi:hypothetical protein BV25DRAFT_1912099 [Artomyces pyxidatus]|uniref:Uncharacterized protein n=1 Tax=Artomyces pyxidatus TaxID=48021 RepID=A0ACB8TGB9_9AGAM|nr:hypothetical protein BV25DRAFT_1912099 [Artomyces pyxidatus]
MKRRRSEEKEHVSRSSPSDDSSHEGDMADTEFDAGPSQPEAGPSQPAPVIEEEDSGPSQPPPAKKKRTRTLTTPHQSAVLHALLAQSRFPTTAMREEVGRSIGLSARKVQVWFQARSSPICANLRQKARRPRSQSVAPPLTRPPQYGAFPNVPSSAPAGPAHPYAPGLAGPSSAYPSLPSPYAQRSAPEYPDLESMLRTPATGTSSSSSGHLSGPGVPGASTPFAPRSSYGGPNLPPLVPPPSSHSPSYGYTESWGRYEGSGRPATEPTRREFSYNLPPLRLDEGQSTAVGSSALPRLSGPFETTQRPFTADSPFAHHPPTERASSQSQVPRATRPLPRLHIPPPVSYPSSSRRNPETPSFQSPVYDRPSTSDVGRRFYPSDWRPLPPTPSGPSSRTGSPQNTLTRTMRFDPVRAAMSEHEGSGRSQSNDSPPPKDHERDSHAA